jgi:hypothetical protein
MAGHEEYKSMRLPREAAAFSSSQLFLYFLRFSTVNFDFLAEAEHQWHHHRTDTTRG